MSNCYTTSELTKHGITAFKTKNKSQLANLFRQASNHDPSFQTAWFWLAFYVEQSNTKRQCLERAVAINPTSMVGKLALIELALL